MQKAKYSSRVYSVTHVFWSILNRFLKILSEAERIVRQLFEDFKVSWVDIYLKLDIGIEKMTSTKEMELRKDDIIHDIGKATSTYINKKGRNVLHVSYS